MTTTSYQVTGMTCGHCEQSVRNEVSEVAGVETVDVSAETGLLVVTSVPGVADSALVAAVEEAGYHATRLP